MNNQVSNNIIGPIDQEDWRTMSCIKGSLLYYFQNNKTGKYDRAIEREEPVYRSILTKYIRSA